MNDNEIIHQLKIILINKLHFKVEIEDIDEDLPLFTGKYRLTSLDIIRFIVAIEKYYSMLMPEELLFSNQIGTIRQIAKYVSDLRDKEG